MRQIPRNIELLRYKFFGDDLLLLELVNAGSVPDATTAKAWATETLMEPPKPKPEAKGRSPEEQLEVASSEIRELYAQAAGYLLSLGEDVQEKRLKVYVAFRRLKNFACVVVQQQRILLMLKLDPATVIPEEGFSRDISQVSHWGTGDIELTLRTLADLERAKPLIERGYAEG
ncbi:DUF5655 domain-containing protein [Cupriavidus campinensis]